MRYVALLILLALISGCSSREEKGLAPGNSAPPIELKDLEGKSLTLDSFRGRSVLLNFWASWCAPCVQEMPALQQLYKKAKPFGLEIVAIAVTDREDAVKKFRDENLLTFPILLDPDGVARDAYKVQGFPESFFLDTTGKVVLFPDPERDSPSVRIVGERSWNSERMFSRLNLILPPIQGK